MRFRPALFWDTDPKKIDVKKHARYIIERILDLGNDSEVRWVRRQYSRPMIKKTVSKSRVLRSETKNLWRLLSQKN